MENPRLVSKKIKVLLAKIGIDGHDRGIKLIALALRDSGMEVVLIGPWAKIEEVVQTALQEDVDIIGISTLAGDYLLIPKLMQELKKNELNIPVIVGGIVPPEWKEKLKNIGVSAVFDPGTDIRYIINYIRELVEERRRYEYK